MIPPPYIALCLLLLEFIGQFTRQLTLFVTRCSYAVGAFGKSSGAELSLVYNISMGSQLECCRIGESNTPLRKYLELILCFEIDYL